MASHTGSDPLDDHHAHFMSAYSFRSMRGTSPYAPNRITSLNTNPTLQRRPPIPDVFILRSEIADC